MPKTNSTVEVYPTDDFVIRDSTNGDQVVLEIQGRNTDLVVIYLSEAKLLDLTLLLEHDRFQRHLKARAAKRANELMAEDWPQHQDTDDTD